MAGSIEADGRIAIHLTSFFLESQVEAFPTALRQAMEHKFRGQIYGHGIGDGIVWKKKQNTNGMTIYYVLV